MKAVLILLFCAITPVLAGDILIEAGALYHPETGRLEKKRMIHIRDGRILAIAPKLEVPEGAELHQLPESTVLPGLMDCPLHPLGWHSVLNLWQVATLMKGCAIIADPPHGWGVYCAKISGHAANCRRVVQKTLILRKVGAGIVQKTLAMRQNCRRVAQKTLTPRKFGSRIVQKTLAMRQNCRRVAQKILTLRTLPEAWENFPRVPALCQRLGKIFRARPHIARAQGKKNNPLWKDAGGQDFLRNPCPKDAGGQNFLRNPCPNDAGGWGKLSERVRKDAGGWGKFSKRGGEFRRGCQPVCVSGC